MTIERKCKQRRMPIKIESNTKAQEKESAWERERETGGGEWKRRCVLPTATVLLHDNNERKCKRKRMPIKVKKKKQYEHYVTSFYKPLVDFIVLMCSVLSLKASTVLIRYETQTTLVLTIEWISNVDMKCPRNLLCGITTTRMNSCRGAQSACLLYDTFGSV